MREAIDGITEGLRRHGLSPEAAEDPEILLRRIERIAAQVHRLIRRPAEHPPVRFPEDEYSAGVPDPEATEALWDELFKHNRRQQERMQRALEERRSRGEHDEAAFEHALNDLGLEIPGEEAEPADEAWRDDEQESFTEPFDSAAAAEEGDDEGAPFGADDERHPLLQRAQDLLQDLHAAFRDADPQFESWLRTLFQGAGDAMGGLAQALSERDNDDADDPDAYGLRIVQLKRSLRGVAFARGALLPLKPAISAGQCEELLRITRQLEKDILQEMSRLRSEHGPDES